MSYIAYPARVRYRRFCYSSLRYRVGNTGICLLYTSDAADDLLCVDLGGRRITKKKKTSYTIIRLRNHSITRRKLIDT